MSEIKCLFCGSDYNDMPLGKNHVWLCGTVLTSHERIQSWACKQLTALQTRLEAAEAKCLELLSESVQTWRLLAMWRALSPYFDRENPYFPKHLEDNLRAAGEIK